MSKSRILNVANLSSNAIRENKILAKISEFTVTKALWISSFSNLISMLTLKQNLY